MNRKKTGMLNSPYRSKRSKSGKGMGNNKIKKKNSHYSRSNYYTSRARGKKARAKSFNYRAKGTRHNASSPYKSGKKKFSRTKKSPFNAKKNRDYSTQGNIGTKAKRKKKSTRGMGDSYKSKRGGKGSASSSRYVNRQNRKMARNPTDFATTWSTLRHSTEEGGIMQRSIFPVARVAIATALLAILCTAPVSAQAPPPPPDANAEIVRQMNQRFEALSHRLDQLEKSIDDVLWHQRLGDLGSVEKVRIYGPPRAKVSNPTLMGAKNPVTFFAYIFVPAKLDRAKKHPLIVLPHGGVHANLDSQFTYHIVRELLAQSKCKIRFIAIILLTS